jgi:hypothetical protein
MSVEVSTEARVTLKLIMTCSTLPMVFWNGGKNTRGEMIEENHQLSPGDVLVSDKPFANAPVPVNGDVRWNPFPNPAGVEVTFTGDKIEKLLVVMCKSGERLVVLRHDFKAMKAANND